MNINTFDLSVAEVAQIVAAAIAGGTVSIDPETGEIVTMACN